MIAQVFVFLSFNNKLQSFKIKPLFLITKSNSFGELFVRYGNVSLMAIVTLILYKFHKNYQKRPFDY